MQSSNILLTRDWTAKIADLGHAQTLVGKTHVSCDDFVGTWAWAAPEAILGAGITYAGDVFSLGVVLLEIITGETPRQRRFPEPK